MKIVGRGQSKGYEVEGWLCRWQIMEGATVKTKGGFLRKWGGGLLGGSNSAVKLIQLISLTPARLVTLIWSRFHVKATQVGVWMFPRRHLCFDVYFGVKHDTVWGKTKTCPSWFSDCLGVYGPEMHLYVSIGVRYGGWDRARRLCVHGCIRWHVWWHLLCCWLGAEHSGGCRSLRLRRWKQRSRPGLVGQDISSRDAQIQSHMQRHTHAACTSRTHLKHMPLTRAECRGHRERQGRDQKR